jgi:type II secretory pathway pseudopilin PulG
VSLAQENELSSSSARQKPVTKVGTLLTPSISLPFAILVSTEDLRSGTGMKTLLAIASILAALATPTLADSRQWALSSEDQSRFDSYYSRWQEYRQTNDREQVLSMEKRMQDVYAHYSIPADTPYWRVASNPREARGPYQGKLSARDQARFDSYFSRWQEYRRENNREQIVSMEKRMQDVYAHYGIPAGTPYFQVASHVQDTERDEWERDHWRGRLSPDDQERFDSYYSRYLEYRRDSNRFEAENMERRMRGIMQVYEIPPEVPYEQIAWRDRH